jgi:hypothetical protein
MQRAVCSALTTIAAAGQPAPQHDMHRTDDEAEVGTACMYANVGSMALSQIMHVSGKLET